MRNALLTAVLVLLACARAQCGETAAPPSSIMLPGTDAPEIKSCPDGSTYVYKIYTIYVIQNADSPGQEIHVYKPPPLPPTPAARARERSNLVFLFSHPELRF